MRQQDIASKTVLPIWVAQLVAVIAFAFFAVQAQIPAFTLVTAIVAAAALMLQMAREQLQQRQLHPVVQWAIIAVVMLIWAIPNLSPIFNVVLLVWGLVICLIYALFAGWIMKISHLRKSMNFSSEAFYNLWRIAVRVVLPVGIILAIAAVLGQSV